ncbi:MAG: hypothetical protein ACOYOL_02075 [Chthoniobacterales bacterium]
MTREDYLRELEDAGRELGEKAHTLAEAANPLNQLRASVVRDWKWWLPGALMAGFAVAQILRVPGALADRGATRGSSPGGATFWIPTLLKTVPAAAAQLLPLILSLRAERKR